MIESVKDIEPETFAPYDDVIDVRSPSEFADDHIPGAINLPVLSDQQRAEVGTIYVQQSRFLARRIGAAHVAYNVATHLGATLNNKGPRYRPLIYCWRGGQRSNSMATILSQIGWRVGVLDGGYRTWRRSVVKVLSNEISPLRVILIDGQTGAAKTEILKRLAILGAQTIDLEAMAAHRGSVFGGLPSVPQPTQKFFESQIFAALREFDLSKPIVVEAESRKIGQRVVPPALWSAMSGAQWIEVRADPGPRARFLVETYADVIAEPGALQTALQLLTPFHKKECIANWRQLAADQKYQRLAEELMRDHYDPLYRRSQKRRNGEPIEKLSIDEIDETELDRAAEKILKKITDCC
jgi:tRNA 2-selenouridine synthase